VKRLSLPTVRLKIARKSLHPWIFSKMVQGPAKLAPGSVVEIVDREGSYVGRGWFNPRSVIALRILTEEPAEAVDESFFRSRIARAAALRRDVLRLDETTDAYRVIHAEGDGISGLVIDRYADHLVVEFHCLGAFRAFREIDEALAAVFPDCSIHHFFDSTAATREGQGSLLQEPPAPEAEIHEGEALFRVRPGAGQKTGFFCDQRENRIFFAGLARGRTVLDGFCYTGGFAVHALLGGAAAAVGIDLDEEALKTAERNARRNRVEAEFVHADVFDYLRAARAGDARGFDAIVLDPSKQAKVREEIPRAVRAYTDMNRLAMEVLPEDGLLVSSSCSGLVSPTAFLGAVKAAAEAAGRRIQILKISGAGADHPVAANCPETGYLKVIFSRIGRKVR